MSAFRGKLTNKGQARLNIKLVDKLRNQQKQDVLGSQDYLDRMSAMYKEYLEKGYITIEKKDNGINT